MKKKLSLAAAGVALAGLAIWGYIEGRKELAQEAERERPVRVPSRVNAQPDGTALVFDAATQKRVDLAVAPVMTISRRAEFEAIATVLPAQELIDVRSAYVAARTQLERARATVQASRRDYERVKALHGDDFNLSTRALESAQAQWQADDAAARGAAQALDAVALGARQKWGAPLAAAIGGDAVSYRRLADGHAVLLRVALATGAGSAKAPATVRLAASDGNVTTATLLSPSPQADPRIQGPTFFYSAPANGLLTGTTLAAYLPAGKERNGGLIPADAVVWWQGKAWYYVQSAPDRFMRRELDVTQPMERGWFVDGLPAMRVVVRGAQTLLSEELRSQIQVGEDEQ